ncbi:MAG: AbrB/MazE/SpoVT family DNA-binding domain-containing protein [Firmicutes bacterium]|nr:AbrB/MazE/SpoVT family DNA-binding domain-containing protein [Bacillota bacterium]
MECLGSGVVSRQGQVVIPVGARRGMGVEPGDTVLFFSIMRGKALVVIKAEQVTQMLQSALGSLSELNALLRRLEGTGDSHGAAGPVAGDQQRVPKPAQPQDAGGDGGTE